MKGSKRSYNEKLDWDDMSYGEAKHNIRKKMTSKVHNSKKNKNLYKNKNLLDAYKKGYLNE